MPRLNGPRSPEVLVIPPDLGLSEAQMDDLDYRMRALLNRWQPRTETPEAVVKDVYRILEWFHDGAPIPTLPVKILTVED